MASRSRLQEQEEYLELRQKFKEEYRRKMKKEEDEKGAVTLSLSTEQKVSLVAFGTFFGPSHPCISRRVIEVSKPNSVVKEKLPHANQEPADIIDEKKHKAQILKKNRDYSFLSSGTEESLETKSVLSSIESHEKAKSIPASCKVEQSKTTEKTKKHMQKPQSCGEKKNSMQPDRVAELKPVAADRPRKRRPTKEEEENSRAFALLRELTKYDPSKYSGRLEGDDRDMEANFHDIQKEENRSARLAREEDKREQLLIEEEEKRERLRKEAKRRKIS